MKKPLKSSRTHRAVLALISLVIITLGIGALFNGHLEYRNWWGGFVFAPFAIVIGLFALLIAIFSTRSLQETAAGKRSRIRGWPTGRARYYRDRK
jgi:fumarate reductase subunit C